MKENNDIGLIGARRWLLGQDKMNQKVIVNILLKLKIPNYYFDIIDYKQLEICREEVKLDPVGAYQVVPPENLTGNKLASTPTTSLSSYMYEIV